MGALYKGLAVAGILAAVAFYFASQWFLGLKGVEPAFTPMGVFLTAFIGLVLTGLIVVITEYFTSKSFGPVKQYRRGQPDRPWHQCDRRPCGEHAIHRSAGSGNLRRHRLRLCSGRRFRG